MVKGSRRCYSCGLIDDESYMIRKDVYLETGKSKSTVTWMTWVAAVFSKKARNAILRSVLNTSQRTYYRKRTLWFCCNECVDKYYKK